MHNILKFNKKMKSFYNSPIFLLFFLFITIQFYADNGRNFPIDKNTIGTIKSKTLSVSLDSSFPRIIQYNWIANNTIFFGQEDKLSQVMINGKLYSPKTTFSILKNEADYILNIPEINVTVKIEIKVVTNIVEFNVIQIAEKGTFKVSSFEIPNLNLLSIRSTQKGASFSGAKMFTAIKGTGDAFEPLAETTANDSIPKGYLYGIVNNEQLAASIWSNSTGEKSDDDRVLKQTIKKNGYLRTAIWSGSWIYRAKGMNSTDPLPVVKIVITNDANNDKKIDWQDGAIAFRSIMNNPTGSEKIPNLVVQRIPMNFASQATNPFTKTLDETKRIFLNTDCLGQYVILKGYGSEGHDSKHPDYGDIGKRQGGAKDMEMLCKQALKYNAFMGVHINGTESYPEASAFNDSLVDKSKKGWDWLDPSYYINKRYDASSNNRMLRIKSLKEQVPSLGFIYCDVWYAKGSWDSKKLGREIHSLGLTLATEFPMDHEYDAVWNHWAVDYDYGGKDIKGFNSQIVRFIRNHQKDTWVARHPLLGGTEMKDFEGWQGRNNFDDCIKMTFINDLPTKYLQHFPILTWEENTITLDKKVSVNLVSGKRTITKDGRTVLNGDTYLLPWNPLTEEKFYHWNPAGGTTTWDLPESWKKLKTVVFYKLSDQGREFVEQVEIKNGQIVLNAEPNTPYVVYKNKSVLDSPITWGEGTFIKDPGFNSGNLKNWTIEGSGVSVVRNKVGQYELEINGTAPATIIQNISGLTAGTYYASVYVATGGNRRAYLGVKEYGGQEVSNYTNSSLWKNYIAADSKHDTNLQRMYIFFKVPEGQTTAKLFLHADAGTDVVAFDDIRVVALKQESKPANIFFKENFENIPDGLYPFIKGPAGGVNDPRTHLSELHAPYTQKGWNGKLIDDVINGNWSLKAHGEEPGLLLQTIPQTIRFKAGKTYTVTFSYETSGVDYALVMGEGIAAKISISLNAANVPTTATFTFLASENGNSWFGIEKLNDKDSDFVLDDLVIIEK
jgi:endo-alpha-N-acetylgalactosaminidase